MALICLGELCKTKGDCEGGGYGWSSSGFFFTKGTPNSSALIEVGTGAGALTASGTGVTGVLKRGRGARFSGGMAVTTVDPVTPASAVS